MGPSGGGKTSIVKLVERFYLPTSGAVLLDGRDVGLYDPRWLKRRVALVAQVCQATPLHLHSSVMPSFVLSGERRSASEAFSQYYSIAPFLNEFF